MSFFETYQITYFKMNLAVVILNWNGKQLLEQFLPSVISNSEEATIYIADNASTDDSIAYVKKTYPQIKIIQNKENGGYAKGYNDALKHVDANIYCLLNSDVEVTKGWLAPILAEFKTNPKAAIIQPKILDHKNKNLFEYAGAAGGFLDKYGYPYCRGRIFDTIEADKNQYKNGAIFWASGACFFIRQSTYKELNGFDEHFFAHMEEIDLCWRAQNLGHHIIYNGDSTVYHVGGATLETTNPRKTYLNFRNSLFTLTKNSAGFLFPIVFMRLLLDGIAALRFLIQFKLQHTVAILKAHFSFYFNLPRLLKQRRQTNKLKNYYHTKSIVWFYFVSKNKTFKSL